MELLFLGTGAGVPAKHRNVSSLALKLLQERKAVWLFDCGEATQHQILHTSLKPRRIEKIFITHLHGDHIFGLPGLLGSRSFQGGESPVTVYGPRGIKEYILTSLKISGTYLKYPLHILEIEESGIIFEDDQFRVITALLEHGLPSYGFRIEEKDRPGELLVEKLESLGIPKGPQYRKLKALESIELSDGRIVHGIDVTGPKKQGRIVTILGDTRPCENALMLSRHADVLVHEATFSTGNEEMAKEFYHSTSGQAVETAIRAGAKRLLLNHISSRYTKEDSEQLEKDAQSRFPVTKVVYDFDEIEIPVKGIMD
ncbi:ribonuclease Z [Bacillus coahuilensis]|uniref:ribonuclease Z n=1 Tax=Bacillus coahuilensis TaxID=408580 RepID=UPI0001851057|nr:ribonuclease Z [Bacillus coahuilensis]